MDYPYNKEERESRRQFFQLFCSNYLYECEEEDAISENTWSADVLCEILHNMYPDNLLTPNDIQSIIYQSGMIPLDRNELYFGYRWQSGTTPEIIAAVGPYITNDVYIRLMHTLRGTIVDSFMEFYGVCCSNPKVPATKVTIKDIYIMYQNWCNRSHMGAVSKKSFVNLMNRAGHKSQKGYANGQSGVNYFIISLDKEAIKGNGEKVPQKYSQHTIGSALRRRDENPEEIARGEEEAVYGSQSVLESKERQGGSHEEIKSNFSTNGTVSETKRTSGGESKPSGGAAYRVPQNGSDRPQSITESIGSEPERDARWRVKHLPPDIREAFTEMKVMCRASVKKPTMEEFAADCYGWGVEATQELYELFMEYLG